MTTYYAVILQASSVLHKARLSLLKGAILLPEDQRNQCIFTFSLSRRRPDVSAWKAAYVTTTIRSGSCCISSTLLYSSSRPHRCRAHHGNTDNPSEGLYLEERSVPLPHELLQQFHCKTCIFSLF